MSSRTNLPHAPHSPQESDIEEITLGDSNAINNNNNNNSTSGGIDNDGGDFPLSPTTGALSGSNQLNPFVLDANHSNNSHGLSGGNNNNNTTGLVRRTSSLSQSSNHSSGGASRRTPLPPATPIPPPELQGPVTSASAIHSNKFRPTLRSVIACVVALIVAIVAASCLVVSNVVSESTARDLGISLSRSLVNAARIRCESYFQVPVDQQQSIRRAYQGGEGTAFGYPSEDRSLTAGPICDLTRSHLIQANFSFPTLGFIFDDGSLYGTVPYLIDGVLYAGCGLRISHNSSYGENVVQFYYGMNNSRVPTNLIPPNSLQGSNSGDSRSGSYYAIRAIVKGHKGKTVFIPSIAYPGLGSGEPSFQIGFVAGLFNATGTYTGIVAMSIPSETVTELFNAIQTTPNSEIIAVDASNQVLASTVKNLDVYISYSQAASAPVASGCLTTNDVVPNVVSAGIVCPLSADGTASNAYKYPPLNYVAANQAETMFAPKSEQFIEAEVEGTDYFIFSTAVPNTGISFSVTVLFFLDQDDIFAEIIRGRMLAAIIAASVFVVAVICSGLLIFWLLKPINTILNLMIDASQLRLSKSGVGAGGKSASKNKNNNNAKKYSTTGDEQNNNNNNEEPEDEEEGMSNIQEIFALQKTYNDMHRAFSSFLRYTSVEILQDILDSGNLAQLGLKPMSCTMLFSDIASFTSICERCDSSTLSEILTVYFDRMTTVVGGTHGSVSNFLGDAIFVVWGAPSIVVNPEVKAVMCALLCARETVIDPIRTSWDEAGEGLNIRQGIHCGTPNVGNVGSEQRINYTLLGDSVNLAARLESQCKSWGTKILISDDIALKVSNIFVLRFLLPLIVVGREEAIKIFEPVGIKSNVLLESVLEHDEQTTSLSLASMALDMSQSLALSGTLNKDSNSMAPSTAQRTPGGGATLGGGPPRSRHISRRRGNKITAKSILQNAMKLDTATIVASEYEARFCSDFNNASNLFCDGDIDGCLLALEKIRSQYDVLFSPDSSNQDIARVIGEERCEATFMRPEISTKNIERRCEEIRAILLERQKEQQQQQNNHQQHELFSRGDTTGLFVYKAAEK